MGGHAAGPVQLLLVTEALGEGRLVRILADWEVKPTEAFLAYSSARFMRPAVRAFTDFVIPALRAVDGIDAVTGKSSHERPRRNPEVNVRFTPAC